MNASKELVRHFHGRQTGVSLLELLTCTCVIGVLLTLGVPSLVQARNSMKLGSATGVLLAQLHLARSEAIKRNTRVALCKSPEGERCTTAGGWEQGWIVFHDDDNDSERSDAERIVSRVQALPEGTHLSGNIKVRDYVSFTGLGATQMTTGAFQAGTFTLCRSSPAPTEARQVVISPVGRPRTTKISVASCS